MEGKQPICCKGPESFRQVCSFKWLQWQFEGEVYQVTTQSGSNSIFDWNGTNPIEIWQTRRAQCPKTELLSRHTVIWYTERWDKVAVSRSQAAFFFWVGGREKLSTHSKEKKLPGYTRLAHPDTKFGCNTINGHKFINNYSQKIIPICCRLQDKSLMVGSWKLAGIEPQFERNWAKDHKDTTKNQQWVTITQSRLTEKINCAARKITPICCQNHRINCWWQEAKNRSEDWKTIEL